MSEGGEALRIWLLDNGGAGFRAQTQGLGRALVERRPGSSLEVCEVPAGWWHRLLPGPALRRVRRPDGAPPTMVIACGLDAVRPALQLGRQHGAFTAYIQRPPSPSAFDAVICGLHDGLEGDRVLPILGSVGGISAAALSRSRETALRQPAFRDLPAPRTAVLIGGANRAFSFSQQDCRRLAQAATAAATGGGLAVTVSRRTGAANVATLRRAFAGPGNFFHDGSGPNPYSDMLAVADRIVVTGDSVNMLSEACSTGRPVWIFPLPARRFRSRAARKFAAFRRQLIERGLARIWDGTVAEAPAREPLNETARAADFVLGLYEGPGKRATGRGI